jgi:cell division protein FtsW (lipid II flippase)
VKQREEKVNATNRLVTTLLLVMAALIVIGMAATISATSTVALSEESNRWYYLQRQLAGLAMGTVGLIVAAKVPIAWYRRAALPLFLVTLGLLIWCCGSATRRVVRRRGSISARSTSNPPSWPSSR